MPLLAHSCLTGWGFGWHFTRRFAEMGDVGSWDEGCQCRDLYPSLCSACQTPALAA